MMGIEPTTFGTTTRRSNQMSYIRQILYHSTTKLTTKKDPKVIRERDGAGPARGRDLICSQNGNGYFLRASRTVQTTAPAGHMAAARR